MLTPSFGSLGKETARVLALRKFHVILACRTPAKGEAAVEEIKKDPSASEGLGEMTVLELSLDSLSSVQKFAKEFRALNVPLHLLVNNAG